MKSCNHNQSDYKIAQTLKNHKIIYITHLHSCNFGLFTTPTMSFANINCASDSQSCGSGCCNTNGTCAFTQFNCAYKYTDFITNPYKYNYPGHHNTNCNPLSRACTSGCCTSTGTCAINNNSCVHKYGDFTSNTTKYSFNAYYNLKCLTNARNCTSGCCTISGNCANTNTTCYHKYADYLSGRYSYLSSNSTTANASDSVGTIAGSSVGAVVAFIILISLIIWCKKKKSTYSVTKNGITTSFSIQNGETTIVVTNNNPKPVFGVNNTMSPIKPMQPIQSMNIMQPSMNPSMNMMNDPNSFNQPYIPAYQPVPQPNFNQSFMEAGYGLANQPQQGLIVY